MSYYRINRQEIFQKAKERNSKEKAAEYPAQNKEEENKIQKIDTKTCHKNKKTRLKSIKRKDIYNWVNTNKKRYKINIFLFFLNIIRMSEKH